MEHIYSYLRLEVNEPSVDSRISSYVSVVNLSQSKNFKSSHSSFYQLDFNSLDYCYYLKLINQLMTTTMNHVVKFFIEISLQTCLIVFGSS